MRSCPASFHRIGAKIDPDASSEGVEVDLILGGDVTGPHRHRLLVLRDVAEEDRARRKRAVLP